MAYGPVNGPGMKGDTGAQGATGANGKSAYQIARENGFVGTEAAWLESLKGAKGDPGVNGSKGDSGVFYGTCDTEGSVQTKLVTANGFTHENGTCLIVNFSKASSVEYVYLNVNGVGQKNITTLDSSRRNIGSGYWDAKDVILYIYRDNTFFEVCRLTGLGHKSYPEFTGYISMGRKSGSNTGFPSVALGTNVTADSRDSMAVGNNTIANKPYTYAGGEYNKEMSSGDLFVLGYGTSDTSRKNVFRITTAGAVYGLSAFNSTGADYAEYFEWQDGNPNGEDRVGRFVTLDGEKVRFATPEDDFILGIVSANASVIGDAFEDQWCGQYVTDIFGRVIMEELTFPEELDEDGNVLMPERTETHAKLSPDFDNSQEYIRRSDRKEWGVIGLMGKLVIVDDGTCEINGYCAPGESGGAATRSESRTRFRVMSRLDETHIRVLVLRG